MIFGVDTHAGYGPIDVAAFKATGGRFIIAKCTEGNQGGGKYIDSQFKRTVAECKKHGVPVGRYHYAFCLPDDPAHPLRGPEEEAEIAFRNSDGLGSQHGEFPPVVDAEHPAPEQFGKYGCTKAQVAEWLRRHCEHTTKLVGRKPIIYVYPAWWRNLASGADVSWARDYLLWLASYSHMGLGTPPDGTNPIHMSWVKSAWTDWAIWQYSADGSTVRVPGINAAAVDRNCIRDEETLIALTTHVPNVVRPDQLEDDPQPIIHDLNYPTGYKPGD